MTFEEFQKKKKEGSLINRNVQSQSSSKSNMSFDEFKARKESGTLMTKSEVNKNSLRDRLNNLQKESTAPNVLEKQNINKDFSRLNISDFVNTVKNSPETKKAQLTAQASDIEKQIKQKEQEYNRANNYSNWDEKMKAKTNIGNELNSLRTQLDNTRTQIDKIAGNSNDKLLTPEQVAEYNKNAPISQKIDKAIKQDIPRTAEKVGRTAMDLLGSGLVGATNAVEGMADAAVGNLGALASGVTSGFGLAPNSLSEKIKKGAEDFARFNFSGEELLEEKKNEGTGVYEPKILNWKVRDALNVISSMVVSAVGGPATFITSAAGQNIEEALLDNQSLNRAVIYGDTAGVVEGLTEKMFDALKLLGGGKFDKFLPKGAISKLVGGSAGEAIEEVIADGINPVLKYFTYEKGTYDMPSLVEYLNILKEAAFKGFTLGFIMKGGQDISTPRIREQYKEEIYTAVDKSNLPENVKQTVKDVMITPAQAQINQDLQNYRNKFNQIPNLTIQRENVTGLPKLNAQNQAQTQNIEQGNATLPTQAEMAQNANMEQTKRNTTINPQLQLLSTNSSALNGSINQNNDNVNEFGKQIDDLLSGKRNRKDSLVVLSNTPKIIQELGAKDLPITVTSSKLERIMNAEGKQLKQYHDLGIDIVKQLPEALERPLNILKSHDNSYVVVTELADKQDRPIIASIKIDGTGRLNDVEILSNVMTSAYGRNNYDAYMQRNIKEGNLVYDIDEGIIKENLTDGARLQLSRTTNEVSNNSINQNDLSVNTEYAQNTQNNTSTYISPVSDIQGATEFVKKATIKDVETLQKMVEEAEKSPDRIDLQFFAEEAKKKIEYLTKSQRYQKNKADTLINKLWKTYGLDKAQVKKSVDEYIEAYNSDGDILEAREALLNELNTNGVLGEYASIEISNDIDNLNRELDTVKRYETDKARNEEAREQSKNYYKVNKDTIAKLYQLKKDYQANVDRTMPKILLTKSDSVQLDRLLKDEISFSELPKSVNAEQIKKAYDVRKPLADVNKEIQKYNKVVKQQRNDKMRELTKNSAQWKDKKTGLAYARETQERNISDIASAEDAHKINKEIFEPIHHNEAEATRYKNEMRNKIKELNIDIKPKYEVTYADSEGGKTEIVSESGLVQLYGEGKINDKTLSRLGVDSEKIKKAVATFREIYNDLYSKTNEVLLQNGYAPVEFRKDYFPHFEETKPDTLIGKALNKLGFKMDTRELPTDIAGLTHTFRPGKKWVSNFLQRTTDVATYDAVKGFDSYLDSVADVIYHTDDIQNLRAYENALRYQHSDPVIKEQIDEVINMDIANEMKQSMIDQLYANAENSLAHYVTDLRAYTDNLAGKKSLEDRTMEHNLGRGIYNVTKNVQSRVSANMVGANISSALTNFIPLTQATSVIDTKNLLQATYDTLKNAIKSDGFAEQSDFLTNRRGSDKLYKTVTDKLAGATNLMSLFDNITSEVINRGRYYQNVSNGMSEADARTEADQMSGKIMADRSKGSMPTVFNQSSPVTKLLTAFQLEVNNQYSYLLKDIPREYKDKAIGSLVWAFAKFFIGAWLYNELYEKMTGRRAALDPINIVTETIGDVKEGKKASEVVSGLAAEIVEEIPFAGGLIGGGRLPISNALPDIGETAKAAISLFEEGDKKKALKTLGSELSKPVFYILPPFGGGQLKKTVEGVSTFAKGGNYGVNAQGQETLKYPVEQTPGNFVKSALFGKWSTKGAVDYVDSGFKALSANQTEGYEKAKKAGVTDEQFYNAYNAQKKVDELGDLTSLVKKNEIDKATKGLPTEKRKILYETFGVAKGEWDNTRIVFPYEIKAMKEKIAREKLKPLKK